jgi:hypothetical protein
MSVHRPPKVIAFNANGIWRRRYELSKQLQDLHIDVALFSVTYLKSHERFFIPNYHFYRTDRFLEIRNPRTCHAVVTRDPLNMTILLLEYICAFRMVVTINSDCFPRQY